MVNIFLKERGVGGGGKQGMNLRPGKQFFKVKRGKAWGRRKVAWYVSVAWGEETYVIITGKRVWKQRKGIQEGSGDGTRGNKGEGDIC